MALDELTTPDAPAPRAALDDKYAGLRHVIVQDVPLTDVDGLVARTAALLAGGVPLSLLLDLASPTGPHSEQLWADEQPDGRPWLPSQVAGDYWSEAG